MTRDKLVRLTKDEIALINRVLRDNASRRKGDADIKATQMPKGSRDSTMDFFARQAEEAFNTFRHAVDNRN